MYIESTKWWKTLSKEQKLKYIDDWKKTPGDSHYTHYKQWTSRAIMDTPAVFDLIYKNITLNKQKTKQNGKSKINWKFTKNFLW